MCGVILGVWRDLSEGDVTGRVNELAELIVGDGRAVHPEAVDPRAMSRSFLATVVVRFHAESTTGNTDRFGVVSIAACYACVCSGFTVPI